MTTAYSTFELPPGFCLLGPVSTQQKVQEWLLVLRSVGLDGSARWIPSVGWAILVTEHQYLRATQTLREYEIENRDWPPARKKDRPLYASSPWAFVVVGLLIVMFAITGPAAARSGWFQLGTANTDMILHGAPWQAVTALTLHADAGHVLGNVISGGIFLTGVHRRLGAGLGTFVTVMAGAAGNLANAAWHGTHHLSIGASTAVFGALGALAAAQMVRNQVDRPSREGGLRALLSTWGPIAAGLVLLGLLGAGGARDTMAQLAHVNRTDVAAHGFGFVAGLALGLIAAFTLRKRTTPLPTWLQSAFGAASFATVAGSWVLAAVVR
jgi:membrane associated rhomboid family serine protease